ncbi:MAG: hypothetical protein WC523_06090 [Patescibacteria group bacterium]|jgi:hypothetical protein
MLSQLNTKKDWLIITIILIISLAFRLSYFLDKGFFIDGDEAIFGLMIKNFLAGGHLPLFFFGQHYAFVSLEVLFGAGISWLLGVSIYSLKLSSLIIWLLGLIFLYWVNRRILISKSWAFLATLLIAAVPVWFDWSLKARGGYLTAFLFAAVFLLLVFSKKNVFKIIVAGLSLVIIYYAQPLWLVILAPFIVYYLINRFSLKSTAIFVSSLFVSGLGFHFLLKVLSLSYEAPARLGLTQVFFNLKQLVNYYLVAYSGQFFDNATRLFREPQLINSALFLVFLGLTLAYNIYLLALGRLNKINALFLSAVILYPIFIIFSSETNFSYRFLLPVFAPSAMLIVLTAKDLLSGKRAKFLYFGLLIYCFFSLTVTALYPNYIVPKIKDGFSEVDRINSLSSFLKSRDVQCVYGLDWVIGWYLNYFSVGLETRGREIDPRQPAEAYLVDRLREEGKTCALVGLWYQLPLFTQRYNLNDIIIINQRYVIFLEPSEKDLRQLNFRLTGDFQSK